MNCVHCGVLMRSRRTPPERAPGAKRHAGSGVCVSCYEAARYRARRDAEALRLFEEGQARVALEAWLSDRRRRIAKQGAVA